MNVLDASVVTDAVAVKGRPGDLARRLRRYPFEPFVARAWELRDNAPVYDAWYVALAETLQAPLVSADDRLRSSDGPRCAVVTPVEALRL